MQSGATFRWNFSTPGPPAVEDKVRTCDEAPKRPHNAAARLPRGGASAIGGSRITADPRRRDSREQPLKGHSAPAR
jgi:hypothetical protein